ncbi:hypothetical protein E2C01_094960 [Portunus trituberculatus]|uniref:Uncharacterized protein n=1 Tax=Portunus trituberculatus TaxID=210409 RepID=A0A5B7JRV5_PORTR|nr:hypothetical protein [Portunus trituberculatus]
MVPLYHGGI